MRVDGRKNNELRPLALKSGYVRYPEGSVLIAVGGTKVLCNVSIQPGIPRWMEIQKIKGGWVTGEYALLPRATHQRTPRETHGLRGRTQEIRRLIGRSLRAAVDLEALGNHTCIVDCDVIQADGGTRTAAISGGYVALVLALRKLIAEGAIAPEVLKTPIAAVSVGIVDKQLLLDLCYEEDLRADVDVNVIMNGTGDFIEVQGTAENAPFSHPQLDKMLDLAKGGIEEILLAQKAVLDSS